MKMKLAALAIAVLCIPAFAEDAPKIDSHVAAAMDVMEAAGADRTIGSMFDTMADLVIGNIKTEHPNADEHVLKALRKAFLQEMKAQVPQLLKLQAAVYAEHFSEADLKAVAAFYRSDVGKRYMGEQPAILKEISPLAFQWGQQAAVRAIQKAQNQIQSEGMKL